MKVLVAPDKFAGTLSAVEAAEAIREGWLRRAPGDDVRLLPMSDGGPGFVDVLHAALGGELQVASVTGPWGDAAPVTLLAVGDTWFVESAQACGLALRADEDPAAATTQGVGEAVLVAVAAGARRVVMGLGGSATTDGGAGFLHALGAEADRPLDSGPLALAGVTRVDLGPARAAVAGVELVAASDVDSPLTGLFGAARTFGPQKGLAQEQLPAVDVALEGFAQVVDRATSLSPGAGAAGGLGFAIMALGGSRAPGIGWVADAVGLARACGSVDLILTGEGAFDFSSRSGKVPYGVAQYAAEALRPCVVLAGRVDVGSREMRALGVESAYSMTETFSEADALERPRQTLAALAERVARSWSRGA